ncbi:MAG TPA: glycogen debranching N-terminal domain-containing protein, partial [Chloroflexota bacterium]
MHELQKLKENDIFAVTDGEGNITVTSSAGEGLYFRDTRFLSFYQIEIEDCHLEMLSSSGELNFMSTLQLTNDRFTLPNGTAVPPRTLSIHRNRFLDRGLHERIGIFNYNPFPVTLTLRVSFGSDFRDMFDVRNVHRPPVRGWPAEPECEESTIRLRYTGLDGLVRTTRVDFDRKPDEIRIDNDVLLNGQTAESEEDGIAADPRTEQVAPFPSVDAVFQAMVPARAPWSLTLDVVPSIGADTKELQPTLDASFARVLEAHEDWQAACTNIWTDHAQLNALIQRSLHDLRLAINDEPTGLMPMAGIPWFSVPFGRDSLITGLQTLCLNPNIAAGALRFLARYQGQTVDPWRDEEPGKILHEMRSGELATLKEVPHTPYYASIDATPLFIWSLAELLHWTGDWGLVASLRPNLELALDWM